MTWHFSPEVQALRPASATAGTSYAGVSRAGGVGEEDGLGDTGALEHGRCSAGGAGPVLSPTRADGPEFPVSGEPTPSAPDQDGLRDRALSCGLW